MMSSNSFKYLFCRQMPKGNWIKFQTDSMESYTLMMYDDFIKFIQSELESRFDWNRFMYELNSFQLITLLKSGEWEINSDIEEKSKVEENFQKLVELNDKNKKKDEDKKDFLSVAVELFKGKKKGPTPLPYFDKTMKDSKLKSDLSTFRKM